MFDRPSLHPRLPTAVAVSALILLAVLALLQYRSTTQLVASQEMLQANALESAASGLRADLWMTLEETAAQFGPESREADIATWLTDRLQYISQASSFSGLVNAVYMVTPEKDALALQRLEPDQISLKPISWPPALAEWRRYLTAQASRLEVQADGSLRLEQEPPPSFDQSPGVTITLLDSEAATPRPILRFVLISIDPEVLTHQVLPELFALNFGTLQEEYVARLMTPTGALLYENDTLPTGARTPDLSIPLASEQTRIYTATRDGQATLITDRSDSKVTPGVNQPTTAQSALNIYHRSGSLAAARSQARLRQLGLAIGIFVLIALALGLLYLVANRAQRLGEQQVNFVAGISHELRTPVAAVNALADNMEMGIVKSEQQAREYGSLIRQEGKRLQTMVEQVLVYAATHSDQPYSFQPVGIKSLVEEAAAADASDHAAVTVTTTAGVDAALVSIDSGAFTTAFRNILQNAFKHGPSAGPVEVVIDLHPGSQPTSVRIRTIDSGPGIATDELARIFEPFFRGSRARNEQVPGNGLGLSLVQRIVEAHGGMVHAENAPGGGAVIEVELPLHTVKA